MCDFRRGADLKIGAFVGHRLGMAGVGWLGVTVASSLRAVMTPRRPRPELRLDVWGIVAATLVAWTAYLISRTAHVVPARGYGIVLLGLAPAGGCVAAIVLWVRARAEEDTALGWVAAGITVSDVALVLQLMSFPAVDPAGGPLRTGGDGSSLLYLFFHWSLLLSALAGSAQIGLRWRPAAITAGVALAFCCASDLVPVPQLIRADQSFTLVTLWLEYITSILGFAVVLGWVVRSGRNASALRAWVAAALSLAVYDVLLNAVARQRYSEEWWASLLMRVATYAVLALAAVLTVVVQLRRHEQYADAELARREDELLTSLRARNQLLSSAQALTSAVSEIDVAQVVAAAACTVTGSARALVEMFDEPAGFLRVLASVGVDPPTADVLGSIETRLSLPGPHVLRTGAAIFTTGRAQIDGTFRDLAGLPVRHRARAIAALPLRLATGQIGALVISDDREREWDPVERQVLAGLADQAAQALARARLFERERFTAEALQRGMLPRQLVGVPGVQLVARYRPGAQGLTVGGDWYDSIPLSDGRNALVVGDVMGKGAPAAAVMGRVRTAVRTLATVDPRPVAVLTGLDRISGELVPDGFVTMLYVLLDPGNHSGEVARAGHLPLLLAAPDGAVSYVHAGGSPAIGLPAKARASAQVPVLPGSTLALFTDGLVENRTIGLDVGLGALAEAFGPREAGAALDEREAGAALDELADRLLARDGMGAYDDVCLLLARLTGCPPPRRRPGGLAAAYRGRPRTGRGQTLGKADQCSSP
jgi:serine phosphatase RsbU (regulator of sigma subunit)